MDARGRERRLADARRMGYVQPTHQRSSIMAAVKRTDTKPEIALRKALHAAGYRFRKDYLIRVDGRLIRPDIAFTKRRVAVFVDGCYWHYCPLHRQIPATNTPFWTQKLIANAQRDRLQDELLAGAGWHVLRVWEHEQVETAVESIASVLTEYGSA